ncbi:MAG: BspA family leucine-rich repeat surface protein, partial [Bacteroidota bacterium]|nr:BspA family leucine-rich repeat surface protein [Bacteroidota bacterium]
NMSLMFAYAYSFNNGDAAMEWDTSSVTNMHYMFGIYGDNSGVFNQDISSWDVSKVTNMSTMFQKQKSFNQNLSNWKTLNVTDMSYMFYDASVFDSQDLSSWDVSNVIDYSKFMDFAGENNTEPIWP